MLTDSRSPFTAEDRVVIAMCHMTCGGNSIQAAERAGMVLGKEIPPDTIRTWRKRPWWKDAEEYARRMLQKDLEHKYTRILFETEKEILDRIQHGDHRLTKDGDVVRVPASLRDLVGAHAITAQQRAMVRGEGGGSKQDVGIQLLEKLVNALQQAGEKKIRASLPGEYEVVTDGEASED